MGREPKSPSHGDEGVRGGIDAYREWFLLDGDRRRVAATVLAGILAILVGVELAGWVPMNEIQPLYYLFSALIGGNITLITVVVSINQLLLSRELKSPGELESQIENVIDYRREVEESAGEVAPVKPMGFLRLLTENTRQEAQKLGGLAVNTTHGDAQERIGDLVSALTDQMDRVDELLAGESEAGTFEVLSVTLSTNYAEQINEARRLRAEYGDELSEDVREGLDGLIEALQNVDVARQYFKGIYLQDELSSLSRALMYAGIPAEAFSAAALLAFTAGGAGTLPMDNASLWIPVVATVGFVPLALLVAFILRTATVAQRTATTLPFTTPEQEQ